MLIRWNNAFRIKRIDNMVDLQSRVQEYGFLPMFPNAIKGFSVYEATSRFWNDDEDGPWEWKGPILRDGTCAYGKFFKRKAVWISVDWLPDFLNYRRSIKYAKTDDWQVFDDMVLQAIASEGSVTTREIADLLGLSKRRRRAEDLVNTAGEAPRINIDTVLGRLMMGGRVCTSDFVYNIDRNGNQYGWGIAKYTTPENMYGVSLPARTPEESAQRILQHMQKKLIGVKSQKISSLLL